MRFINLTISDDIPDSKNVWNFKEQLVVLNVVETIFSLFIAELERLNLIVNEGEIFDASFVKVPKQRNKREENKQIKESEVPDHFEKNQTKRLKKMLMLYGQRRIMKTFMATKIM